MVSKVSARPTDLMTRRISFLDGEEISPQWILNLVVQEYTMTLFNETLNGKDSTNVSANNNAQSSVLSTATKAEAIQGWLIDKLAEVLEIEPNQIDVGQDFEEYGLESAEAINL